MTNEKKESLNFIEQIIEDDIKNGVNSIVHTRFPPEPNGYLHIGHVKAICTNFGIAEKFGGLTNLRFDDTNPTTEETEYVDSIRADIKWLGFDWDDREYYASDYFPKLYEFAIKLIKKGLAYVDDSTAEEIAEMKGTPTEPGKKSPFRDRSIEENLDLFEKMKNGGFPDGSKVLRAKIDMSAPNMHMRDPVLYRIKREHHHRTGDEWIIYPLYDFAHGQSDSIENITYSLCSIEFRHHRPLYDWFIKELEIFPSRQIEFARMNVAYMITSKRKLKRLVEEGHVTGWDDPRMPTVSGMRRRGYPATALRVFSDKTGLTKRNNVIEIELLESCVREELNKTAARVMGVLDPLKVIITNYPEDKVEEMEVENNPGDPSKGIRKMPFSRELYIEREDFMEEPPKKFFRLGPDKNVRLKAAYIIKCDDFVKNEDGEITELHCTYFPDSRSGSDTSGVKAKGVLHWVSAPHALEAEVRLYDKLFSVAEPLADEETDFVELINPDSIKIIEKAYVEPSLKNASVGQQLQFMRKGYFCVDSIEAS
jgi:glutaminyl-tRNA synthetase